MLIDKTKCSGDHRCAAIGICPTEAIDQNGIDHPVINPSKCIKCRRCEGACSRGAIYIY